MVPGARPSDGEVYAGAAVVVVVPENDNRVAWRPPVEVDNFLDNILNVWALVLHSQSPGGYIVPIDDGGGSFPGEVVGDGAEGGGVDI
ncbi:hypothetical protein ES703_107260 [subsurface metagenome]